MIRQALLFSAFLAAASLVQAQGNAAATPAEPNANNGQIEQHIETKAERKAARLKAISELKEKKQAAKAARAAIKAKKAESATTK